MPLTSDRDKADEIQAGKKKGIPTPVAVFLIILVMLAICIAGYFMFSLILLTD